MITNEQNKIIEKHNSHDSVKILNQHILKVSILLSTVMFPHLNTWTNILLLFCYFMSLSFS